ncbi:MAG: T9SS type A sorting domain-containing protein [Flavobacteriales bacterium]|nr:T9SS type A sorting domain-containing protein [Flavobacteriales bacterium]
MYSNFSTAVPAPSVSPGNVVPFSVQIGTCGGNFTNRTSIWIDWNRNGLLTDPGEEVFTGAPFTSGPNVQSGNITVPISASSGLTLMRVVNVETSGAVLPCGTYSWGETEDYFINIVPAAPCVNPPTPGTASASASSVCPGTNVLFSVTGNTFGTGQTYQWEYSPTNTIFSPISGATSPFYSVAINAGTVGWYRLALTCGATVTTNAVQVTNSNFLDCYCTSNATSAADEDIFNVTFGALNNSSTCATLAPGPGSILNMYSNYKTLAPVTVVLGDLVPFSVQVGTCGGNFTNRTSIFVDWNRNGQLTDPGETIFAGTAVAGPNTQTGSLVVPVAAGIGLTLLRVVTVETSGVVNPCGTYTWGETEDYLINVVAPGPCLNPPTPGTASASGSTVCPGTNVTFSVSGNSFGTGQTYQWQFSPDNGITPWVNVPGATSVFYSAPMNTAGWYRLELICNAGTPSYTNSVQITISSFVNCYCSSTATSAADTEMWNVTLGTLNNTSTCASIAPGPGSVQNMYSNYTTSVPAPVLNQAIGQSISVTVGQCGAGNFFSKVAVFIDWNQNGVFSDPGELVVDGPYQQTVASSYILNASFTVPVGPNTGLTRMRVIVAETSLPISPCGTYTWGETEDYLVNIGPPPTCLPPSTVAVTTTGPTSGSVNITCTACTGNFYVEYGAPGFVPGTQNTAGGGTLLGPFLNTDFPIALTGLVSNTTYGVRVRRDCGAGDWSPNSTQQVFTTALTCGDTYVDQGGIANPYPNFANHLVTICPNIPNASVMVVFSSFDTETSFDPMYVFNGPSTASPMIASTNGLPLDIPNLPVNYGAGGWWGTTAPNNIAPNTVLATNPSGCLTFHFVSDDVVQNPGWVASVNCITLNNTCADAQTVTCNSSTFGFTGAGATNLPPDACPFNGAISNGGTSWFKYIAGNTGEVTASVCGTASWNTRISVFRALSDCNSLQCWALNDDTPGCANGTSELSFPTTAGDTYYIVVHGVGTASGTYSLVLLCNASCGSPVPNETCTGALGLTGALLGSGTMVTYDNTCAYSDGTPSCGGASPTQGLWFNFNSGTKTEMELTLHTNYENSSFTATGISYAVYDGACTSASATGELTCVTNGAGANTISGLTPGGSYKLLVYNTGGIGVQGTFGLNLEFRPDFDALIESIVAPNGLICGTLVNPVVILRNNGLVTLTTVRIYYNVDGGPDQIYQWNGSLASGATVQVALPPISAAAGTHLLNARTEQPNNQPDEIPGNDGTSGGFNNTGQPVRVVIRTDNFGNQIGWDIIDGFGFPVASGGLSTFPTVPYGNNTLYTETFCLPTTFGSCYSMFLYDINGDGMCCANGNGFWEIQDPVLDRLILRDLFASSPNGSASPTWTPASPGYVNGHEFCLPMGPADIEDARCNIFTYTMLSKVFSTPVAGATNYQFEFTDPDAGFRRRIAVPRNWVQFSELTGTNPLIPGVVYFARVRVDQGSPGFNDDNFGAGCDMGITGAPNCTSLINQLTLPTHSCNVVKSFGFSDKIWTYPVVGATNYRFRFTNAGEGYQRVVGRTNYVCPLNWLNQPLVNGSTYQVDVEVRVSGVWSGYCGGVCTVTIANPTAQGGRVADGLSTDQVELWPNPVSDGQVNLRILGLTDREQQINVDVFDLYGKRVLVKHFENSGELFNTVLDLGRDIAAGMYQVNITVNDHTYTERLSVQ